MFIKTGNPPAEVITIYFENKPLQVQSGITVAAAVLDASHSFTRTTKSGHKRGPYCHMGVCHECLMTINGVPNQQSCLITVADGMRVERQNGSPNFGFDDSFGGNKWRKHGNSPDERTKEAADA